LAQVGECELLTITITGLQWQTMTMVRQILSLTSIVLLLFPILFASEAMAQSSRVRTPQAEPRPSNSLNKVESGSSVLGVHEVNLKSIQTQPLLPTASKRIAIEKTPEVKFAPVHRGAGIVSPADEDEGLQVEVTGFD
jgi:hypothetical protein